MLCDEIGNSTNLLIHTAGQTEFVIQNSVTFPNPSLRRTHIKGIARIPQIGRREISQVGPNKDDQ